MSARSVADRISAPYADKNGDELRSYQVEKGSQKDGRGYAFPYDDVVPDGGQDVAGTIFDGSPKLFTIAVGGQ